MKLKNLKNGTKRTKKNKHSSFVECVKQKAKMMNRSLHFPDIWKIWDKKVLGTLEECSMNGEMDEEDFDQNSYNWFKQSMDKWMNIVSERNDEYSEAKKEALFPVYVLMTELDYPKDQLEKVVKKDFPFFEWSRELMEEEFIIQNSHYKIFGYPNN